MMSEWKNEFRNGLEKEREREKSRTLQNPPRTHLLDPHLVHIPVVEAAMRRVSALETAAAGLEVVAAA